jgi:hypothetical protein
VAAVVVMMSACTEAPVDHVGSASGELARQHTRTVSAAAFTGAVTWNPVRAAGQNTSGEMFATIPMQDGETPLSLAVSARAPSPFDSVRVAWIRTSEGGSDFVVADNTAIPPFGAQWFRWELTDPDPHALAVGESITVRVTGFGVTFGNSTVTYLPPALE